MKNEPKKSTTTIPIVIIGIVFVGVIAIVWWLYTGSKEAANANANANGNRNSANNTRTQQIPTNAPAGATPPHLLGSPTAAVTVEEFADFQCPTCASTHPTLKEIQSAYGSKIRFIFRNYPLPMHDKAYDAAVAAEAAGMQGKFWAMQDQLFTNQQAWSGPGANAKQLWTEYAEKIGLDVQRFQNDISGMAAKSRVDQDVQRAKALNVSSTPSVFVNGQLVPFPEMNSGGLRRIIDAELQKTAGQSQPATSAPAAPTANSGAGNSNAKSNSK